MFYVDHSPRVIRGQLRQCISGQNVTDANPKTEETDDILTICTNYLATAIIHRYNFDLGFLKYSYVRRTSEHAYSEDEGPVLGTRLVLENDYLVLS